MKTVFDFSIHVLLYTEEDLMGAFAQTAAAVGYPHFHFSRPVCTSLKAIVGASVTHNPMAVRARIAKPKGVNLKAANSLGCIVTRPRAPRG